MTAVHLAQSLQTIITRNRNPLDAAVLSITQIHTGSADNVVPNHAVMRGTVRTRSEEHTSELQSLMSISYAVFCLKKKHKKATTTSNFDRNVQAQRKYEALTSEP